MQVVFHPHKKGEIVAPPTDWSRDYIVDFLTSNKIYDVELFMMYDKDTFKPIGSQYIIKCDDGEFRKVPKHLFKTLQEIRETKLKEIGI